MTTTFADLGTLTFAGANWAWNDWPRIDITITLGTSRTAGIIFAADGTRLDDTIGATRYTTTIAPTIQHRKAQ